MIKLAAQHFLCETGSDLPEPRRGEPIYLDCETRRRNDEVWEHGNEPYLGDRACMWAIAFSTGPSYAVPLRMRDGKNLDEELVRRWLRDHLNAASEWRNHNVKFDAHFATVDDCKPPETLRFVDTVVMSKILNSDRLTHGLKELSRELLGRNYESRDRLAEFLAAYKLPNRKKAKCYSLVPTDILAEYACDDVLNNRALFEKMFADLPDQVKPTWEMEQQLTPVLFDMEHLGLRTDERQLRVERMKSLHRQIALSTRINELTGMEYSDNIKFTYGLICGAWALPVLSRDKKSGNPSFDKDALKAYLVHPEVVADPVKLEVVTAIVQLRKEETYCSLFVDSFLQKRDARGYVHSDYNQIIRTGRMSCSQPNAQQFDERAKRLVLADSDTDGFLDADASQIEFRFIVHHIKDEEAIAAYQRDPKTDFHAWVAELCKIKRKPAKTINFAVAFGAGQRTTVSQLAANQDVIEEVTQEINAAIERGEIAEADRLRVFTEMSWEKGQKIYETYHERFPTLKTTSRRAGDVCRSRGFIFNVYGRRRHLPAKAAHNAFNTICQGGAMDFIKRRMIATSPRNWPELRAAGITMRFNVHDAVGFHGPVPVLREWQPRIVERLQQESPLRVPIFWDSDIVQGYWRRP